MQHQILPSLMKEISVFEAKLDLFISHLNFSNFTHFPALSKAAQEFPDQVKSEQFQQISLKKLKLDLSALTDIRNLTPVLLLLKIHSHVIQLL